VGVGAGVAWPAIALYTFFPKKNGNPQSNTPVLVPPRLLNAVLAPLLAEKSDCAFAMLKLTVFEGEREADTCVAVKFMVALGQ
jgi:hypothetical protein